MLFLSSNVLAVYEWMYTLLMSALKLMNPPYKYTDYKKRDEARFASCLGDIVYTGVIRSTDKWLF